MKIKILYWKQQSRKEDNDWRISLTEGGGKGGDTST